MANGKSAAVTRRLGATTLDESFGDGELLGLFNSRRDGSAEAAFEALVRRHGPMVLRACGQILADRHGAEDAFQATFLVLARKAGSIRRPELLGNWLYGVALRTAREAKMRDGRRRRLESPAAEGVRAEPTGEEARPEVALICREEFAALHEEVARLPERYRVPVVLCELEGLTYEEVARRMHCPVSTIGVRLIRARERLRTRLIRRGIAPAAALLDGVLGTGGASALMPAALIDSTVRGASLFAATDGAAVACVSSTAVTLTDAVLGAMALAKLKLATSSVLVIALAAGVGWVGGHRPSWATGPAGRGHSRADGPGSTPIIPSPVLAAPVAPSPGPKNLAAGAPEIREAASAPVPSEIVELAPVKPIPAPGDVTRLAREERSRGEALFFKEWVRNDPASPHGDGLGPVFNETSCVACHGLGAPGGGGPESKNVVMLTALGGGRRPNKKLEQFHPGFQAARSTVLHRYGTDPSYASWRRQLLGSSGRQAKGGAPQKAEETVEARISRIAEQTSPKGRSLEETPGLIPAGGANLSVSERNTPALFGAGRIDAISSEAIAREAKWQPAEVRGRVSRDRDGRVGRFGWKAQVSRLHEFVRVACAGELGLEVPGHSQSISPLAPDERAKGLDLTDGECDALVSFVRALPSPVAIDPDGLHGTQAMREGRLLFAEVGCATCHAPSLGEVRGIYSDLLLHEMGPSLSDTGEYYGSDGSSSPGGPSPGEWRTPPLWGFRDSGPYLHDGRAETLEEAVALHGGQGGKSAKGFFSLPPEGRSAIETFLKSLVAPSAASAPGVVLAAELESRFVPEESRQAELLVRIRREEAEAREVERKREADRRQLAEQAAKLAPGRFQRAWDLERAGKKTVALEYYRRVVREAPETEEARSAAERINALQPPAK
jgi:RNA polymerase sigma factor (sigma-70 family)